MAGHFIFSVPWALCILGCSRRWITTAMMLKIMISRIQQQKPLTLQDHKCSNTNKFNCVHVFMCACVSHQHRSTDPVPPPRWLIIHQPVSITEQTAGGSAICCAGVCSITVDLNGMTHTTSLRKSELTWKAHFELMMTFTSVQLFR